MTLIDTVAEEIATEAHCIGLSHLSWNSSPQERKDAWRMLATAAICAARTATPAMAAKAEERGHLASDAMEVWETMCDAAVEPEREGV
jgi:hypothetical protein